MSLHPSNPHKKDPVAPILSPPCQCRGEISLQERIALHEGVAATLTPIAVNCATKLQHKAPKNRECRLQRQCNFTFATLLCRNSLPTHSTPATALFKHFGSAGQPGCSSYPPPPSSRAFGHSVLLARLAATHPWRYCFAGPEAKTHVLDPCFAMFSFHTPRSANFSPSSNSRRGEPKQKKVS